jgi:hypothetical protein
MRQLLHLSPIRIVSEHGHLKSEGLAMAQYCHLPNKAEPEDEHNLNQHTRNLRNLPWAPFSDLLS